MAQKNLFNTLVDVGKIAGYAAGFPFAGGGAELIKTAAQERNKTGRIDPTTMLGLAAGIGGAATGRYWMFPAALGLMSLIKNKSIFEAVPYAAEASVSGGAFGDASKENLMYNYQYGGSNMQDFNNKQRDKLYSDNEEQIIQKDQLQYGDWK